MGETEAVRRIQELDTPPPPGLPLPSWVTLHESLPCPGLISSPGKWTVANLKPRLVRPSRIFNREDEVFKKRGAQRVNSADVTVGTVAVIIHAGNCGSGGGAVVTPTLVNPAGWHLSDS